MVSKLVVVTKSASTEVEVNRQRLGKQLEALLHKVFHLVSSDNMVLAFMQGCWQLLFSGILCTFPSQGRENFEAICSVRRASTAQKVRCLFWTVQLQRSSVSLETASSKALIHDRLDALNGVCSKCKVKRCIPSGWGSLGPSSWRSAWLPPHPQVSTCTVCNPGPHA